MKMQKASFTIEAVIWIPLILCMMVGVLKEGINFYKVCVESEVSEEVENWDAVARFYDIWAIKELEEKWKDGQTTD